MSGPELLADAITSLEELLPYPDPVVHARVERILTALRSAQGWQPIETAPKDGTRILLAKIVGHPNHETALWWAVAGHWSAKWNNWNDDVEPCGLASPNYWHPLPTPPEKM